jgi:hypothetical protein
MTYFKKFTVKGLCGRCLLEFLDWRYSQSCWYFRPSFVNYCPSNFLSGSPPPPPSLCQSTIYTDRVWLGGDGGVLRCVGDHILQEFNTLWLTTFRTEEISYHPKQIPRRWDGLRQINTCRRVPVPLQVNFFRWRHFALLSINLIFLRLRGMEG